MSFNPLRPGIKSWAESDRPREKLLQQGRRALTDAELIAILIGSGNRDETAVELSKRILYHYSNDLGTVSRQSVQELARFKGIGEAKAISIIAALELGRRRSDEIPTPEKISTSRDVFYALKPQLHDLMHEEFWVIYVSRSSRILHKGLISKGGLSETAVDPKVIFKIGLEHNAASLFLAHNHPSGNFKPSHQDIHLTKRIAEAGRLLEIAVLDHVIFVNENFYSFADNGLL